MSLFVHGEFVEYRFPTSLGLLDVGADVLVQGSSLTLCEPVVYAGDGSTIHLGVRPILEIARQVEELAKLQGFSHLYIEGHRLSGANPGRPVHLSRRIR